MASPRPALPLLARFLPRRFREQVIEPAYSDLLLDHRQLSPGSPRHLAAHGLFLAECLRLGLPAWLWWRGRPTRLSRGLAAAFLLVALALWIVATQVRYD